MNGFESLNGIVKIGIKHFNVEGGGDGITSIDMPINDGTPNLDDIKDTFVDNADDKDNVADNQNVDNQNVDNQNNADDDKDNANVDDSPITEINIDDVDYKLDADGNALDEQGNIKFTSEEIQAKLEVPTEVGIEDIYKITNIVPTDTQGNPIKYELTTEGISQYVMDASNLRASQLIKEQMHDYWSKNQDILEVARYKQLHGTIEGFKKSDDYASIKLDENNIEQQKELVIQARLAKGDSKEDAERFAEYSKVDAKLLDDAKAAQAFLVQMSKQKNEELDRQIKAKEQAEPDPKR